MNGPNVQLEDLKNGLTILAILAGGVWALFNYFKGRVHRPRLEPSIKSEVIRTGGVGLLMVRLSLRNAGLSKVDIAQKGTGFRISGCTAPTSPVADCDLAQFTNLGTFSAFDGHDWIEPGETISQDELLLLPSAPQVAIRVELRIAAHKLTFRATCVVPCEEK